MAHWLFKSEPDVFSFDDLLASPRQTTPWDGVRNYQARNFMRDAAQPGDNILYYHSNTKPPAVVGLAEVASRPYPDPTQFDPESPYYDPKATREKPRWVLVDVRGLKALSPVTLSTLKADPRLSDLPLLKRGNRLSVMPVSEAAFKVILELAGESAE